MANDKNKLRFTKEEMEKLNEWNAKHGKDTDYYKVFVKGTKDGKSFEEVIAIIDGEKEALKLQIAGSDGRLGFRKCNKTSNGQQQFWQATEYGSREELDKELKGDPKLKALPIDD